MTRHSATAWLLVSLTLLLGAGLVLAELAYLFAHHPARTGATAFTLEWAGPTAPTEAQLDGVGRGLETLVGRHYSSLWLLGFATPRVTVIEPAAGRLRLAVPEAGDGVEKVADDLAAVGTRLDLWLVEMEIDPETAEEAAGQQARGGVASSAIVCEDARDGAPGACFRLAQERLVTNEDVQSARVIEDQFGFPSLTIQLTDAAGARMRRATGAHQGGRVAILVGGKLVSAPVIQGEIDRDIMIQGLAGTEGPARLAAALGARGRLPPVTIVAREPISPAPWLGPVRTALGLAALVVTVLLGATFLAARRLVRASI